jgi:DMSO/TMAO reductase YedYZ molybdopterin-dependent catalytic subunit
MGDHEEVSNRRRARLVLAGVLTGLAGTATSMVTTAALNQRATPVTAVAEAVIEHTPGRVAEAAISVVGTWDKPLLVTGVSAALLLLSGVAGLLAGRNTLLGSSVFLAMGAVAAFAALSRPNASPFVLLPVGVGVVTWVLLLPFLARLASAVADPGEDRRRSREQVSADRRRFLVAAGVVAAGSVAVGVAGRFVGRSRRLVESARDALRLPVSRGTVPEGADLHLRGTTPWRVPNPDFYRIDTALVLPAIEPDRWRLRIHGMVDRELTLTYADLLDRRLTEAWVTLCCVSNPVGGDLVGNAWWSGVRIAELLEAAGPKPGADAVLQTSHDGWTCGTPLSVLTDDRNAMLAIAMNGVPLPLEHGFPVRMVVPGLYGFVSATKWLVDLQVTRFDAFEAYWTSRGWSEQAPVRTQSRIEVPRANRRVGAGRVSVGGTAWAQHTGIERVQVQLDGGAWQDATLGRVPGNDTWVQWQGAVEVAPGNHTLAVRATDRSGYTQTGVRREVAPDGATGWHTIDFTAE